MSIAHKTLFTAVVAVLLGANSLLAQNAAEKSLPLDGRIMANGSAIELNWFDAKPPRVGSVTVKRRLLGQIGAAYWKTIAPPLGPVMRFVDDTTQAGVAYEYQVLRTARDIVDVGYWTAGVGLRAEDKRGTIYLVVDETVSEALAPRLGRFVNDLTGDGWRVLRHDVPRGDKATPADNLANALGVKDWLHGHYVGDPFGQHAVVLVGHIPVVKSGKANPDGHNALPHPSDLFYADMDGRWAMTQTGELLENRLPNDFIEMQIGRIDFSSVSDGDPAREIRLLRAYFDKNHHWRHGMLGNLREAYGQDGHLQVEKYALRNIVGPEAVTEGGHHDTGEWHPWLWGVAFGHWNGYEYAEKYANKAVFALNFGSGKQFFDAHFNAMTGLLAQPFYTIAVGWGARPAWRLHPMALGGTIGSSHMRTVNNGQASQPYRKTMDYFPTGDYLWRNPVWVNLLGDPTTRAFMLAPPTHFTAEISGQHVVLSWAASDDRDVIGYRVYRAPQGSDAFTELEDGAFVESLSFTDETPKTGARYMVRAYGLKSVYAGSFYTFSQGVFAEVGAEPVVAQDRTAATPPGQTLILPAVFDRVTDGQIRSFVEGPDVGMLAHDSSGWRYTPPAEFTGEVILRFSVSDGLQTDEGRLTITVGD